MKHRFLHVIEKANLVGLADDNDMEVVECIYDHIHPLVCGKFIVVKDKRAGILDSDGKILMVLQQSRLYNLHPSDIFWYKSGNRRVYFTFKDKEIVNIDAVKIKCLADENDNVLLFLLKRTEGQPYTLFDSNLSSIQTDFDNFELSNIGNVICVQKTGLWGAVAICESPSRKLNIIINPMFCTKEEAINSLIQHLRAVKKAVRRASYIPKYKEIVAEIKKLDIFDEFISRHKYRAKYIIGCKNGRWGVAEIQTLADNKYQVQIIIEPTLDNKKHAKEALVSYIKKRDEKNQSDRHDAVLSRLKELGVFDAFDVNGINSYRYYVGCKDGKWGVVDMSHALSNSDKLPKMVVPLCLKSKEDAIEEFNNFRQQEKEAKSRRKRKMRMQAIRKDIEDMYRPDHHSIES